MGEKWTLPTTASTWAAFAYLVLIGSGVVFYLYLLVLSRWTASATAYSFLLIPVATVVVAALLLGEAITASFLVGAVLTLAGVWVLIRWGGFPPTIKPLGYLVIAAVQSSYGWALLAAFLRRPRVAD